MAKYRKFIYNAGYVGTEVVEIHKFSDDYSDRDIDSIYEEWWDEQNEITACGDCLEISEEEVQELEIDEEHE